MRAPLSVREAHDARVRSNPATLHYMSGSLVPRDVASGPNPDFTKLVLAFGGYISLTYVLGYVRWWAYLDAFGAAFLIGQVPIADVLFSSANVVLVGTAALVYLAERRLLASAKNLAKFLYVAIITVFLTGLFDLVLGDWLLDKVRAACFGFISFIVVAVAVACVRLGMNAYRSSDLRTGLKYVAFALFLAFCVLPFAVGFTSAFDDRSAITERLPRIEAVGVPQKLYALFATGERVYCVTHPAARDKRIFAVPWSSVLYVVSSRSFQAKRFAHS